MIKFTIPFIRSQAIHDDCSSKNHSLPLASMSLSRHMQVQDTFMPLLSLYLVQPTGCEREDTPPHCSIMSIKSSGILVKIGLIVKESFLEV